MFSKVLEVGGGSGANFEYVTTPVSWTVLEPNKLFAPYFNQTVKDDKINRVHHKTELVEVRSTAMLST